jgi:hypothetical protein
MWPLCFEERFFAVFNHSSGAKQAAEKGRILGDIGEKSPFGAKARIDSAGFMRGLKTPPPSEWSFSATCKAQYYPLL